MKFESASPCRHVFAMNLRLSPARSVLLVHRLGALILGLATVISCFAGSTYQVLLPAAPVERAGQVITFQWPAELSKNACLMDASGNQQPFQRDETGQVTFVVSRQKADQVLAYRLEAGTFSHPANVTTTQRAGEVQVVVDGHPLLAYRTNRDAPVRAGIDPKFKRAGYLHPIMTPAGQVVTDDAPANHPHHHGLWFAWSMTQFQGRAPNFWELGELKGAVEFKELIKTWSGPVHGGFIAEQRMIDFTSSAPMSVLDETWDVTAYQLPPGDIPVLLFDLVSRQRCSTPDPLVIPKYRYGGFGFRGAEGWDGRDHLSVLTSEGETDRNRANTSRVRWCYLGPAKGGSKAAGVVILGHPENFRAPQPLRVHPEMPFICFAPTQLGDFAIEPDRPLVGRYRIMTLDHAPDAAEFEAYWQGYAYPARADVQLIPLPAP